MLRTPQPAQRKNADVSLREFGKRRADSGSESPRIRHLAGNPFSASPESPQPLHTTGTVITGHIARCSRP